MANRLVNTRLPERLFKETEAAARRKGYASIQEFVRHAVRQELDRERLREGWNEFQKLKGSAKNAKIASKSELDRLAREKFWPVE